MPRGSTVGRCSHRLARREISIACYKKSGHISMPYIQCRSAVLDVIAMPADFCCSGLVQTLRRTSTGHLTHSKQLSGQNKDRGIDNRQKNDYVLV